MKERKTKRQRRGTNPDLDELNMTDHEILAYQRVGTTRLESVSAIPPAPAVSMPPPLSTEPRQG